MKKLRLTEHMSANEKRMAVQAALLLGFQEESAAFPIAGIDGEIPVPGSMQELESLWKLDAGAKEPEGYEAATEHTGENFELDYRTERGLECIFGIGEFLKDEDGDGFADRLDVKLVLTENADLSMTIAACNIAFRFGMETTGYEGEILAEEGYHGNAVIFGYGEQAEMTAERDKDAYRVYIRGCGEELESFSARICETFPKVDVWRTWQDVMLELADDFVLRNPDGQLAALRAAGKAGEGSCEVYGSPEITEEQKAYFKEDTFYNFKSGRKAYEKTWELPWEADVFRELLEREVYPKLHEGDVLQIEAALSEDKSVRRELAEEVSARVSESGAQAEKVEIICAYKQGFSWLEEVIIPKIKEERPDKIEIYFRPFLPEGQTEWNDENGATPSYHNVKAEDPDKWYDLPIRYLQELYPIEDVLVRELGISRDSVEFRLYEGDEDLTYLCRVLKDDEVRCEETCLVQCEERAYLDEFPQLGKVHPASGYLRARVNGKEILNQKIRTDMAEVWDVYQSQVLPECRRYIEKKYGDQIQAGLQPFFQKLLLDVTASEPDYRVGCREDLISSLDALHEDMYFAGTDYFKNYGMQHGGEILDAPGLILPEIHERKGKPVFRAVLYEQLMDEPCILQNGRKIAGERPRSHVALKVSRLFAEDGKLGITVKTRGVSDSLLEAYAELFTEGVLESGKTIGGCDILRLEGESGNTFDAVCAGIQRKPKTKKITEIDLHEHEVIGYETYLEIIEQLREVEGIEILKSAVSYMGRQQYAIWLKKEQKGYLSMTKYLTARPCEMINARHHANEVSSTNAAFILLKKLLTEEKYSALTEKLNLIIVPMENVDGAAIHYELQKEHPYWKFHVARFNSLGKEFFYESFRQDTIHTEALGQSRLFTKYLPDISVDNHGVPSHEWEQQFSGYTSPSYKGFWLPRSLLYGYFWYVTDTELHWNYLVNKEMEDVIADKIAEDPEMTALNMEWSAQFEKYAHKWMPKLFPADYYKNMINYWIPYQAGPANKYPSARFPWVTTVSYTSEVADETAQGDYLNLCARAHVAHDEATIEMLMRAEHIFDCSFERHGEEIFARYRRQRPMIVRDSGENR